MFGSKLRTWMENHIVRPRKKTNKNKNAHGNVESAITTSASCSQDAYKKNNAAGFTIHHGSGTMSTAQTATTTGNVSAATASISQTSSLKVSGGNNSGCSSSSTNSNNSTHQINGGCSNNVISSPARRREVSPIQNHSRYGWHTPEQDVSITSPKSDNFLCTPRQHRLKNAFPTHINKESSSEDKLPAHRHTLQQVPSQPNSSSSISSLSWSTGSKEPSISCYSNNNNISTPQQVKSVFPKIDFKIPCDSSLPAAINADDDPDAVHYEEIKTILRHPEHHENKINNNFKQLERPKSEQIRSIHGPTHTYFYEDGLKDDVSPRYGRLLPSKIHPQSSGSFDTLNANIIQNTDYLVNNNLNYQYYIKEQEVISNQRGTLNKSSQKAVSVNTTRQRLRNNRYTTRTTMTGTHNGGSFNVVGGGAGAPSVPSMGILHSLSSPESAYSTGYSTDGNSPGGIYTPPEYYINMRTGTHYFPKSVNSLAIEAQRYKFGLNKIEEMSPIDPLPNTSFASANSKVSNEICQQFQQALKIDMESGHVPRNTIVLPTLQGFESPSPRQRCRIRTNPWYSTTDTSSSGTTVGMANLQHVKVPSNTNSSTVSSSKSEESSISVMKMELDAGSTSSSGIKSSNEAEDISPDKSTSTNNNNHLNGNASYESSESSSSLTEVENKQRTYSPNTIRHKRSTSGVIHQKHSVQQDNNKELPVANCLKSPERNDSHRDGMSACTLSYADYIFISDDDATLNEMMGKFDESYVYEKETDILSSDSDQTDCVSDLDTGQDAGDECDTDEFLDIDFIDTSSVQELHDKNQNTWSKLANLNYFNKNNARPLVKINKNIQRAPYEWIKTDAENNRVRTISSTSALRRKKRFLKTRKKIVENQVNKINLYDQKFRETRSVGGTPVLLRKNTQYNMENVNKERNYKTSPLVNRSSSMVFEDTINDRNFMTLGESEKTLLKADLEADVKYRLLIMEAETLLASMRNSVQSIPRETPVASPRRINPLVNKRVELLKNSEVEPKKDKHVRQRSLDASSHAEQELGAVINKRVEHLKQESSSAPNSPRSRARFSPRKTHVTNFISQNVFNEPLRKINTEDTSPPSVSPKLFLNGRPIGSLNNSPLLNRRNRSQSPKILRSNMEESDSDMDNKFQSAISNMKRSIEDMENHNYLPSSDSNQYHDQNFLKPTFLHFKSVNSFHCPQSEPLKRKIYKDSSTYERMQQSFELDSEIPKQMLLQKIHSIRRDRNQCVSQDLNHLNLQKNQNDRPSTVSNLSNKDKQQLIVAIVDLKRSLENQSVELNGLNEI